MGVFLYHQDVWELPAIVSNMVFSIVGQTVLIRVGGIIGSVFGTE